MNEIDKLNAIIDYQKKTIEELHSERYLVVQFIMENNLMGEFEEFCNLMTIRGNVNG